MTPRRWFGLAATIVAVLVVGRIAAGLYVDYRWYDALGAGARAVWRARLVDLVAMRIVLGVVATGFYFANLYGVSGSVESLVLPRRLGDLEIGEKVSGNRLLWGAGALAVALGIAASLLVDDWMSFDLIRTAQPFGVPEPYTGADLSFFVHWLPFENALYVWALTVLLSAATIALVLYALTSGLRWEGGHLRTTRHVRRHLTVLASALLLLLAWGHRLDAYALLSNGSGPHGLFTFVDYDIVLRTRFALAIVTAMAALVVLRAGWQGQARVTFWVLTAVFVSTLLLRGIVPAIGSRLVGRVEAERRNAPFLNNRAYVTQNAYGVNTIAVAPPGYGLPSIAALSDAAPLWDPAVLARAVEHQRRGEIAGDELGWQPSGGRLAAVVVTRPVPNGDAGARDVEPSAWRVLPLAATAADLAGDPVPLDDPGTGISSRPRRLLVFPQATGYSVTSDSTGRIAADPIDGFWARLAHAWDQRDFRLLLSDQLDRLDAPVIVLRRGVRDRLDAVAPFFTQGHVVSPVVVADTLFWVSHLYAAAEEFPLSQRYNVGVNVWGYFQHAAIGIVNAETGHVTLLADGAPGQLAAAWIRRFPMLFTPPAALDAQLLASLPPATDGVMLQASALSQYGSRRDIVGDSVRLPIGDGGDSTTAIGQRALGLLPHPATGTPVPAWTMPMVDASDRVTGLLIALGGRQPTTLWMPVGAAGRRWREVIERLHGAAAQLGATGSEADAERGRVRAWPIGGRVAYGQASFLVSAERGPSVTGVVTLVADTLRTGRSWADALGVAPAGVAGRPSTAPGTVAAADARVRALYDAMRAPLRRGDWAAFGAAFDSLGATLGRPLR
jgi:uncharacterized membrane protein (UPF0182 family)